MNFSLAMGGPGDGYEVGIVIVSGYPEARRR
jgi:hypothetical protein